MANAARDPYFHASVRRETIDHPSKAAEIQHECAACHVPIAQKTAHAEGRLASILSRTTDPHEPTERRSARARMACRARSVTRSPAMASARARRSTATSCCARRGPTACARSSGRSPSIRAGRRSCVRRPDSSRWQAPHVRAVRALCVLPHADHCRRSDRTATVIGSLPEQMNFQEWQHSAFYDGGSQLPELPHAAGGGADPRVFSAWEPSATACRVTRSSAATRSCSA